MNLTQLSAVVFGTTVLATSAVAQDRIAVSIENTAPRMGTFQTPVWVGLHNGRFNMYDRGIASGGPDSPLGGDALERLAEDGITAGVAQAFTNSGYGMLEATVPGPSGPIGPGDIAYTSFMIDPMLASSRYLSYGSMVLPSNDAFIANGNPTGHPLYNAQGQFIFRDFFAGPVLDAGTEVNDEVPSNTAFLAQMAPNTGVDQGGVVERHPGFLAPGMGGILDLFQYRNGSFTRPGYSPVMIRVRRAPAITEDRTYLTLATGDMVVPSVSTPASVRAAFLLRDQGTRLEVRIERRMLSNITSMGLYMGAPGSNGALVLQTAGPLPAGGGMAPTGVTIQQFGGSQLTGPMADYPLDALIAAMEAGEVYFLVKTSDGDAMTMGAAGDNPAGELRGQLVRD